MRTFPLLFAFAISAANAQNPGIASVKIWTVSAAPTLSIGGDATPQTLFKGISAVRTQAGELVVLDDATNELRVFSPTGAYVRSLSRRGAGPGEIEGHGVLAGFRDTIFVFENSRRILQTFTPAAGFVRQQRASASNAPGVQLLSRVGDGAWLGSILKPPTGNGFVALDPKIRPGDWFADTITLGVISRPDSGHVATLGSYVSHSLMVFTPPALGGRPLIALLPNAPKLVWAASGGRVWVGSGASATLAIHGPDATGIRTVTLPVVPRPINMEAVARVRARILAVTRDEGPRTNIEAQYSAEGQPKLAPLFRALVPGPDGEMWVQLFDEDPDAPSRYLICNREGVVVAQVLLPGKFAASQIGADYVLGVQRDEDDVESVVMLRLRRTP